MSAFEHALVAVGWRAEHIDRLVARLAPAKVTVARWGTDDARAALGDADAVVLPHDATPEVLAAPKVRWIHCDHAGIDGFAPPELFADGRIVTTSAGRSAPVLAEHALWFLLALSQEAPRLATAQRRRTWSLPGAAQRRGLVGRTVLIVGCGHTGRALAVRCRAMGMEVLGYRRRSVPPPDGFHEVFARDDGADLRSLVGRADAVVLAASLNDASQGMVGAAELAAMRPGAYLVNVGRGGLVDERALVHALRSGPMGGAGLDVVAREPLVPWSPLWRAPNLILTPHQTPRVADREAASLAIVEQILDAFDAGEVPPEALGPEDALTAPLRPSARARRATTWWARAVAPRRR